MSSDTSSTILSFGHRIIGLFAVSSFNLYYPSNYIPKRLDSKIAVGVAITPMILFGCFLCYEQGRYLWTYPQRKNALHQHWEIVVQDDTLVEEDAASDRTQTPLLSRPASEMDLLGSEYDFRPLTIRIWHRIGDFIASLSPHHLFATLFSSQEKPTSLSLIDSRRNSSVIKLRQRLYNSLCVAGRFVNPFYTFEDRNLTNLYDYIMYQLTRKNRNDVPTDTSVLEETMPLMIPNFDLMLEYTRQSQQWKVERCASPRLEVEEDNVSLASSNGTKTSSKDYQSLVDNAMTVTWLGQSTCFIQMDGYNILTDPIFSSRTVGEWFGPKRIRPTPCDITDLPSIDIVLVSHNHYDHLDRNIVNLLGNSVTWYVPLGLQSWFAEHGVTNVVELDWWQETYHQSKSSSGDQRPTLFVASTPVQHWSGRHFFDVNASLWSSFVLKGPNSSFFHCGDTGYCPIFRQIGQKYGPFTFAALPIGSYEPRYFLKHQHIDPYEAALIHQELGSRYSMGVHWGTFMMSDEYYLDPPRKLEEARIENGFPEKSLFTSRLGETILLPLKSDDVSIPNDKRVVDTDAP